MGVKLTAVLLLVAIFGSSTAQECTIACPRSLPTNIIPKVESTYVYSLEAKTLLNARDTQKVTIKADAEVSINSVCESSLRLKNVAIEGVTGGDALAAELSSNPAGFGYMNGQIYGFCPAKGEAEWAANVKRAVISALQISASGEESVEVEESDFSGKCPTRYSPVEKKGEEVTMSKKKDLNACSERRIDLRLQANQALAQFKELIRHYAHPLDSRSSCKITVKDKAVNFVECEETHTLSHRPHKPIQISNIKLSLKEVKAGVGAFNEKPLEMQKIFVSYEHSHKHDVTEVEVVAVLKKLCEAISAETADIESSTLFSDLVSKLRYLSDDATVSVDEAVKSGSICVASPKRLRELFLDASAFAASDASIKTLVKAHDAKELSISRAAATFTVIALKAAPKEETVQALLPIIKSSEVTRPMLLGFSILARRYCEKTNDCQTSAAIKDARDAYLSEIAKTQDHLKKITMIKALENLNLNKDGSDAVNKLLDETINSDTETGCKVAAVNAMIDDPSTAGKLKEIIKKESNPNEVRIAAFQKYVKNNGMKDGKDLLDVEEKGVKNYIASYVKNLKKSKILERRSLAEGVEAPESSKAIGISKSVVYEYGPYTVELDVIYPKESNVTRALGARVFRIVNGKFKEISEITVRQEGLEKEVGNVLNLIARKVRPDQFGVEAIKQLSQMSAQLKKKDHKHFHLQITGKINGKNVLFTDAFEDIHTLGELIAARVQKVLDDKKIDRTIGGVLIDTKVVVPTITGLPLIYKLEDNFVIQINGMGEKNGDKRHFILNRSLVAGIHAAVQLKLKDNKLGYEYDGKLSFTPHVDFEISSNEKKTTLQINTKDDKRTLLKFKQSLKEVKKDAATADEQENELVAEPRSDNCFSMMVLNYCRKASQVKGLLLPNVEYYVTKPESEITAIIVELERDRTSDEKRFFSIKLNTVGGKQSYEHLGRLDFTDSKGSKEIQLLLKSPNNKFETKFVANLDKTENINIKLDLPHMIDINLNGKFSRDKDAAKSDILVEYKFPGEEKTHTIKYKNSIAASLKRTSKDKVASLDYSSSLESSRKPYMNYRTLISFKYRPYKVNDLILEFAYGSDLSNLYKFSRISKVDVQEFRPFQMTSESETKLISTDFDIHYEFKSDSKVLNDKGKAMEFDLKLEGKDLSKRHAGQNNDIKGVIKYRNKGANVDSNLEASLNLRGREMAWNSEMKQVEPQKYEGKITIQTDKDKKIFINHKNEVSKPTKEINIRSEAEISYSYKPDKKSYKFDAKKDGDNFVIVGEAKKDGKVIFSNDIKFEKNGKLKAIVSRDVRSYDLTVDNVFRPKEAALIFKIEDRVYNFDMKHEPWKFIDLKVVGNDKALIQKGDAHLSVVDASTINLLTKANTKVELMSDVIASVDKKLSAKIDSPKYNFVHDGVLEISFINQRLLHKSYTKIDKREFKYHADLARKGSLITLEVVLPERTSNVKYSRQADRIMIDFDTSFLQGKIEGDQKSGKIHLKNAQKDYELESTYKRENGKLMIESVTSKNAKLEAVISRYEPSKLVLETPETKANMELNAVAPVKTFKFNFDNPRYTKKIDAEMEPGKKFRYDSQGKSKVNNKEMKVKFEGIPMKELKADIDLPDIKFKIDQLAGTKKVKFSYTFNNYTEDEEFDFDPNKAYIVNWLSAFRQYGQTFIVQN